jgi:hypothetical protein
MCEAGSEFLPSWCRLCRIMEAAVQRWPGVERITIYAGGWDEWYSGDEALDDLPE